jgi:hypothetical protein
MNNAEDAQDAQVRSANAGSNSWRSGNTRYAFVKVEGFCVLGASGLVLRIPAQVILT